MDLERKVCLCRELGLRRFASLSGCLLLLVGIWASEPCRARELTLAEAFAVFAAANEDLKAAAAEERRQEHLTAAARSLYLPRVEFEGRYTRIDDPIAFDLNDIRQSILDLKLFGLVPLIPPEALPPFELTLQDESFWRAQIKATWPVFAGGRISAANRAARARLEESREESRQTRSTLASELVVRYFGLRMAEHARAVRAQVLQGMQEHARQALRLEQEGLIARAERLHAEVALAEADRQLKAAGRDTDLARTALANILATEEPLEPVTPLFLLSDLEPMEEFVRTCCESHPLIRQMEAKRKQAHEALRAERGRWLPEIYLFGLRELYEPDLTLLDPRWAAGAGARWSIFEGGARWHNAEAAKSLEQRVRFLEEKVRRDLATLVEKRYHEALKAWEQFDALEAALGLTRENLRVRTRAFEEGLATSLDVVDAEISLAQVRLGRLAAAYDFDVALARLLEASGQSGRYEELRCRSVLEVAP